MKAFGSCVRNFVELMLHQGRGKKKKNLVLIALVKDQTV